MQIPIFHFFQEIFSLADVALSWQTI
jgi:hypothetical protein